jgi:putative peptidoglycan lipid II flippase
MTSGENRHFWSGFWATSLATLASRVLGLVRDVATASLLGLGEGGVMDAFVIAFRIPNLLRRIFGEGALAASFLPAFTAEYQRDRQRAWKLVSVLMAWLALALGAFVVLGEIVCAAVLLSAGGDTRWSLLAGLTAIVLPYLVFICLAAQASAALQALFEFRLPAAAPMLLNVCWLAAAWGVAPRFAPDAVAQAYVISAAILISGVLQFGVQLPALRRLGFRFDYDWAAARGAFGQVIRATVPIGLGMAVTQLNTLVDSLVAWSFSAGPETSQSIAWLGGAVDYPMRTGAAAAIYYGERFYQFPVGILGLAIATVFYPLISRHAARGDRAAIGADLTLGLRLVWFAGLPASLGIMLVADPLTRLLFERGAFTAEDAARAAGMIATYASGVWAYCAIPILVRGYYAVGDRITPAKIGLVAVSLNVTLNLTLIWLLAEQGLAVATAIAAAVQVLLLTVRFSRGVTPLDWPALFSTLGRSAVAAAAMAAVVMIAKHFLITTDHGSRGGQAAALAIVVAVGVGVYLLAAQLLGMREPALLLLRPKADR